MSTINETDARPSKIRKLDQYGNVVGLPSKISETGSIKKALGGESVHKNNVGDNQEIAPEADGGSEQNISKNQLKKLIRRERWEANRELRTVKRREKHKEKKARKAQQRTYLEAKIESGEIESPKLDAKNQDKNTKRSSRSILVPIGLIVDTDFNDLMTEKEIISLGAQLTRCYSLNRSAPYRTHLAVSAWNGVLKSRFENVLSNTHLSWTGVEFLDGDFISTAYLLHERMLKSDRSTLVGALANNLGDKLEESKLLAESRESLRISEKSPKSLTESEPGEGFSIMANSMDNSNILEQTVDEASNSSTLVPDIKVPVAEPSTNDTLVSMTQIPAVIYLTSDSPHTLTCLNPNTSYIIGGIVDKNRHKGLCYKRACERGIPTAKLPIEKYMNMQSRTVLTINHVVEIMLKWLEINDWGEAFLNVIPKRKQAVLKTQRGGRG